MKKALSVITIVVLLAVVFCSTGCDLLGKDYEGNPKDFTYGGLTITLTDRFFELTEADGVKLIMSLSGTSVAIAKEFTYLTAEDLYDHANRTLRNDLGFKDPEAAEVVQEDNFVAIMGVVEESGKDVAIVCAVYIVDGICYVVTFGSAGDNLDEIKEPYLNWARSVVIN